MVKNRVQVSGKNVKRASARLRAGRLGDRAVARMARVGDKMYETTKDAAKDRDQLAILVDGEIISYPVLRSSLRDNISISGRFSEREAFDLASALENPLEKRPADQEFELMVSPAYGKEHDPAGHLRRHRRTGAADSACS